jgi:hypothetical protein
MNKIFTVNSILDLPLGHIDLLLLKTYFPMSELINFCIVYTMINVDNINIKLNTTIN